MFNILITKDNSVIDVCCVIPGMIHGMSFSKDDGFAISCYEPLSQGPVHEISRWQVLLLLADTQNGLGIMLCYMVWCHIELYSMEGYG